MLKINKIDKNFPQQFHYIEKPIEQIYYQGNLSLLKKPYLAVVGARAILPWIELWMEQELMPALKSAGLGVVSGGARGVDQLAHICALRAGVSTLVILPSGLNKKYPKKICKILGNSESIGYISEYDPDEEMRKHFFYSRNRLIAAFSPLTLVVQAAEKSGTMITARYSMEYGRSVVTLPATPLERSCAGNLQLIYEGSYFVRDCEDLKALFFKYFNSSFAAEKTKRPEKVQ